MDGKCCQNRWSFIRKLKGVTEGGKQGSIFVLAPQIRVNGCLFTITNKNSNYYWPPSSDIKLISENLSQLCSRRDQTYVVEWSLLYRHFPGYFKHSLPVTVLLHVSTPLRRTRAWLVSITDTQHSGSSTTTNFCIPTKALFYK